MNRARDVAGVAAGGDHPGAGNAGAAPVAEPAIRVAESAVHRTVEGCRIGAPVPPPQLSPEVFERDRWTDSFRQQLR